MYMSAFQDRLHKDTEQINCDGVEAPAARSKLLARPCCCQELTHQYKKRLFTATVTD